MRRWKDPFPPTPKGFHDRVEQTLGGLEERKMKHTNHKLTVTLAAALIILATAAAAMAVVLGNARFKRALTAGGADDVAALVQEVHVPAAGDGTEGFGLSIDEILWEDDLLYFSYTASVPEDGGRYLLALYAPLMNGEAMCFNLTGWERSAFFDDRVQQVIPLGGTRPASCGQLLTFRVGAALRENAANALFMRADFFRTDTDFTGDVNGFESAFKGAVPTVCLTFDPTESLKEYAERLALPAAETAALQSIADAAGTDGILTPGELSDVRGIEYAARREARMVMDAAMLQQTVYDGVEETEFEVNGCKVSVEDFHMTHLGAGFRLRVTAPDGLSEAEGTRLACEVASPGENSRQDGYQWSLFRPDGSELALDQGMEGGAGFQPLPDGTPSYVVSYEIDGIIPLDGLDKVVLMPYNIRYDDHDRPVFDYLEDWAIELTPVLSRAEATAGPVQTLSPKDQATFDRAMNGEVMTRLERRVAVVNWQEGDPGVTVYATKRGAFYHVDSACSGMSGAHPQDIEEAVQAGKQPCPDCIGGQNAPVEVDIFTGIPVPSVE